MSKTGTVYLVGAGPGDAGLLTLRGAELLRRADIVVYDVLINPELLRFAPATAELISRGSRTTDEALSQELLNALTSILTSNREYWLNHMKQFPLVRKRRGLHGNSRKQTVG